MSRICLNFTFSSLADHGVRTRPVGKRERCGVSMTDIPVSRLVCRLRWLLRGTDPIKKEELIGVCKDCLTGISVSVSRDFGLLCEMGRRPGGATIRAKRRSS